MAYVSFLNLRKAIRERLEGVITDARAVTVGRLEDAPHGLPDGETKRRALVTPRFDIPFIRTESHPNGPTIISGVGLVKVFPIIHCFYALPNLVNTADDRDAVVSVAETDGDIIRQALSWRGSLTDTSAAAATGLVSGMLTWIGFEATQESWGEASSDGSGVLRTSHSFEGVVQITQATS